MTQRKHVVIVGGGFGGLAAAKGLVGAPVDVTLIDRSNHHLFQPLLYQVATAALSPSDIASATRSLFRSKDNIRIVMDEVTGVDSDRKQVITKANPAIAFDYLILATGADYSFFGNDSWIPYTSVLKTMEDALGIRERLLAAFELAEQTECPDARRRLLTFVIVGAGPTGVEMAGAIAELGRTTLAGDFQRLRKEEIEVILVDGSDRVLGAFEQHQSETALRALQNLGVQVWLSAPVQAIDSDGVMAGGNYVAAANVIWCAGTRARDSASWIAAKVSRNGAIVVNADCSVPELPFIFAIGDGATYTTQAGPLPGLAPVAKQQGRYVARVIRSQVSGKRAPASFEYRNWGMMAVIGRSHAIADFGTLKLSGFTAWLTWSLVHLLLLIDFRSKTSVYLAWSHAWFTRARVARLLTRNALPNLQTNEKQRPDL